MGASSRPSTDSRTTGDLGDGRGTLRVSSLVCLTEDRTPVVWRSLVRVGLEDTNSRPRGTQTEVAVSQQHLNYPMDPRVKRGASVFTNGSLTGRHLVRTVLTGEGELDGGRVRFKREYVAWDNPLPTGGPGVMVDGTGHGRRRRERPHYHY